MVDIKKLGGVEMKWNYNAFVNTLAKTESTVRKKTDLFFFALAPRHIHNGDYIYHSKRPEVALYKKKINRTKGGFKKSSELALCLGAPRPAGKVSVVGKVGRRSEAKHNDLAKRRASFSG